MFKILALLGLAASFPVNNSMATDGSEADSLNLQNSIQERQGNVYRRADDSDDGGFYFQDEVSGGSNNEEVAIERPFNSADDTGYTGQSDYWNNKSDQNDYVPDYSINDDQEQDYLEDGTPFGFKM